jgi:hypothetical protein
MFRNGRLARSMPDAKSEANNGHFYYNLSLTFLFYSRTDRFPAAKMAGCQPAGYRKISVGYEL